MVVTYPFPAALSREICQNNIHEPATVVATVVEIVVANRFIYATVGQL